MSVGRERDLERLAFHEAHINYLMDQVGRSSDEGMRGRLHSLGGEVQKIMVWFSIVHLVVPIMTTVIGGVVVALVMKRLNH